MAASNASFTGNGATITIGGTALARVIQIDGFEETLPDVDDSTLATTSHQAFIQGDLIEHGELSGTIVFDDKEWVTNHTIGEASAACVLTFPICYGQSSGTNATLTGYGWLKTRGVGEVANNQRIEAPFSIRFEGGNSNKPTFTAQS